MGQSVLTHLLGVAAVLSRSRLTSDEPRVMETPQGATPILQYQVSEYLPEVRPRENQDKPPVRRTAQKADPEYSPQKIVSLNAEHNSTRQTIIQSDPAILHQDVPLPNLVAWTPIPGAPVASRHPLVDLPMTTPQVAAPAQQPAEHSRLVFPL